jgi:hypothetical protein
VMSRADLKAPAPGPGRQAVGNALMALFTAIPWWAFTLWALTLEAMA